MSPSRGTLSDWRETNGLMLPWALSVKRDDFPGSDYQATSMTVDGPIGDLTAPAEIASAPESEPAQANVTDEELADGVWYLAGQSHHSVLVEFPTYGALVEAPQNDTRALAVIARARELLPADKPLRYLVNTHHHFDHSGGLRAAVAEGLTVITHEINADWYRSVVARPHTVQADHLAQNPAELMIETVTGDEVFELSDGNRVMQIRRLQNDPHNEGMLVVYLPAERILIEADVYSPPRGGPTAINLYEQIQAMELRVDRIAPIHGPGRADRRSGKDRHGRASRLTDSSQCPHPAGGTHPWPTQGRVGRSESVVLLHGWCGDAEGNSCRRPLT